MDEQKQAKDKKSESKPPNINESEIKQADTQDEKYDVSHAPTPHVVHVQKSPWRIIFVVLLILLLAGGAGYLGYLYLQEKDNANNLQQQINSSQSQTPAQSDSAGQQQPQANDVSYSAEVGNFTLTLPNGYIIIKNIDGGFEGGPVTDLEIAKKTDDAGVVENSFQPNRVYSVPKQGSSLDDFIENRNQEYAETIELSGVTVDESQAKVFRLVGLFDINRVYFENGDNFYELETLAPETQDELSAEMNAIIAGFKFN